MFAAEIGQNCSAMEDKYVELSCWHAVKLKQSGPTCFTEIYALLDLNRSERRC